jgi:hypothetical protein
MPPIKINTLEKHKKYKAQYKPNDLYWGLGIERECYLEASASAIQPVTGHFFNNQARERYSVDYYKSYKPLIFNEILATIIDPSASYYLPVLINAHSFLKSDAAGEANSLYKKGSPQNPKFRGSTLFQELQSMSAFFRDEHEKSFTFDGDTIELMTQRFYKASVSSSVREIIDLRNKFIDELNHTLSNIPNKNPLLSAPIKWMTKNYGVARMLTNLSNIAIFNNGTYHINITLPTQLDSQGKIKDMVGFVRHHRHVIHYYQWLEPLLIAHYGTGDFLAASDGRFAKGSLRNSLSRYIGVGTYNTKEMNKGKILTIDASANSLPWMQSFYKKSAYESLQTIGLDINFNKHHNHGIEFRIFDWFPEEQLEELLTILVHAADAGLQVQAESPRTNSVWNIMVEKILFNGKMAEFSINDIKVYLEQLDIPVKLFKKKKIWTADEIWLIVAEYICKQFTGECTEKMLGNEVNLSRCFLGLKL